MKFPCTIERTSSGRWLARHAGSSVGTVEASAATRDEAMTKLRGELQYRLELCPCSGRPESYIELEVVGGEM